MKEKIKVLMGCHGKKLLFWKSAREIEGLESLEGDFYTRFKPEN